MASKEHEFDFRAVQIGPRVATAATFLQSCAAKAISPWDGPRHSLHALAKYREYNEDFLIYRKLNY